MDTFLQLTREEKEIYNSILFTISRGNSEFSVTNNTDMKQVSNLVKIVLAENSEYFYYDNCKVHYSGIGFKRTVKLTKWVSSVSVKFYVERFNAESKRIIAKVIRQDMTKMQKILALHNYLIENVSYFDEINDVNIYQNYHTAYGAIVDKCAVCEGISAAYCYLLSLVGIKSTVVNGTVKNIRDYGHSWNVVEVDGRFYHFDVTWNLKNKRENKITMNIF